MRKVKYEIEKSSFPDDVGKWVVLKYSESGSGFGVGKVFKGTQKACKEYLKKIKKRRGTEYVEKKVYVRRITRNV